MSWLPENYLAFEQHVVYLCLVLACCCLVPVLLIVSLDVVLYVIRLALWRVKNFCLRVKRGLSRRPPPPPTTQQHSDSRIDYFQEQATSKALESTDLSSAGLKQRPQTAPPSRPSTPSSEDSGPGLTKPSINHCHSFPMALKVVAL